MSVSKKVTVEGTGENVGGERGSMAVFVTSMESRAVNRVGSLVKVPNTASQNANSRDMSKSGKVDSRLT